MLKRLSKDRIAEIKGMVDHYNKMVFPTKPERRMLHALRELLDSHAELSEGYQSAYDRGYNEGKQDEIARAYDAAKAVKTIPADDVPFGMEEG